MAPTRITTNELLDALAASANGTGPEDARTADDLAREANVGIEAIRTGLRELQRQGRLVVHRIRRLAIDGVNRPTVAYTVTPPPKKSRG